MSTEPSRDRSRQQPFASASTARKSAPWHLRAFAVVGIIWNGFAALDYTRFKLGGAAYLRDFGVTEAQISYTMAMPAWATAVWALGVYTALLGSLLLFVRSRHAVAVFGLSLLLYVLSLVYTYALSNGGQALGPDAWQMQLVVLAGCLWFALYAWIMARRGVLR